MSFDSLAKMFWVSFEHLASCSAQPVKVVSLLQVPNDTANVLIFFAIKNIRVSATWVETITQQPDYEEAEFQFGLELYP